MDFCWTLSGPQARLGVLYHRQWQPNLWPADSGCGMSSLPLSMVLENMAVRQLVFSSSVLLHVSLITFFFTLPHLPIQPVWLQIECKYLAFFPLCGSLMHHHVCSFDAVAQGVSHL